MGTRVVVVGGTVPPTTLAYNILLAESPLFSNNVNVTIHLINGLNALGQGVPPVSPYFTSWLPNENPYTINALKKEKRNSKPITLTNRLSTYLKGAIITTSIGCRAHQDNKLLVSSTPHYECQGVAVHISIECKWPRRIECRCRHHSHQRWFTNNQLFLLSILNVQPLSTHSGMFY